MINDLNKIIVLIVIIIMFIMLIVKMKNEELKCKLTNKCTDFIDLVNKCININNDRISYYELMMNNGDYLDYKCKISDLKNENIKLTLAINYINYILTYYPKCTLNKAYELADKQMKYVIKNAVLKIEEDENVKF